MRTMNFSEALDHIKSGVPMCRTGWNGEDMFVFLVNGSRFTVNRAPLNEIFAEGTVISYHAHIDMKMADGRITPWLPSQPDILSDDWFILKGSISRGLI